MTCKDCAESVDGAPGGSCCGQCLEEQRAMCEERIRALDPPLDWDDEERVVEAMEEGETFEHRRASAAFKGVSTKDSRIAELEAALEEVLPYAQRGLNTLGKVLGTDMPEYDLGESALQRAKDALAKKTTHG